MFDPIVKRFLNADSYGSTGQGFTGFNMFAYCGNNPVIKADFDGSVEVVIPSLGGDWLQLFWEMVESCGIAAGEAASEVLPIGLLFITAEVYPTKVITGGNAVVPKYEVQRPRYTFPHSKSRGNLKTNRPSVKKVTLDMDHIMSGHSSGGNRGPNKDRFPSWMTPVLIEQAIRFAYKNAEKAGAMQYSWQNGVEMVRQFFRGQWNGISIEFWFNHTLKMIETAWPK